jgi:glutamate-1-semialdehyde 2,1-aminomutase
VQLEKGIASEAKKAGVPISQTRVGTMFTTFFGDIQPRDWTNIKKAGTIIFAKFFRAMLENGVYLAPSQFEAGFLSITHTPEIVGQTIEAARKAFTSL